MTFDVEATGGDTVRACALAMNVLSWAKCKTWDELHTRVNSGDEAVASLLSRLWLSDEQLDLIGRNLSAVATIRLEAPRARVVECDSCHRWMTVAGSTTPRKCDLTLGCGGAFVSPPKVSKNAVPVETFDADRLAA